jgi:proline iminopeptidase
MSAATTAMRQVRGIELFERRIGVGPEVVVLHGGPGAHHDYLLPGFDRLARQRTLIYYDQRGGGRSPVSRDANLGWREHVHDLEALRDVWGLQQLHLAGYSWGALLAMLYAIEFPSRVASLALISPAPAAQAERSGYEARLAERNNTEAIRAQRSALQDSGMRQADPETYQRQLFSLAVAGYFHQPSRSRELTPFRITFRTQQAVWDSLGDDLDLRPKLRELQLPALVVHGDDDPIPLSTAQATAEALRGELVILPDCGHVPYVEAPEEFTAALDRFLPRQ